MPELSCEHLEVFAVDPHAAAEEEVRAMAAELLDRRAKDYETNCAHLTLARVADELGCTRDGLDLWFAQTVVADRDQARARVAELEAQRDRVTDLFETWAAEENEHLLAGEHGLAEGLHVAIEMLRLAVHGTNEPSYPPGGEPTHPRTPKGTR